MNLSDKIWITRKTRIFTEKRLKKNTLFSELFIIVFSLLMVFFSIWNYIHANQNINFLLICGAIALLTVSIFLYSQRFSERAHAMRNCYISLDELYFKVSKHERDPHPDVMDDYQKRYNDILINIENHSPYDYLCLRHSLRNNNNTTLPPFTLIDYTHFIIEKTLRILLIMLLLTFPFLLAFVWIKFI